MRKKIKWILLLSAIFAAALLGACAKGVDLNKSAVVDLKIVTDAGQVEVFSSQGELSGEGKHYTVTVQPLKDFLITVSAAGYQIVNVPVTVADLASGRCEKTVNLVEKLRTEVSVSVDGYGENPRVFCGETELEKKSGVFYGEIERDQLKNGIRVTAENAEPRSIALDEKQLSSRYVNLSAFLVPSGKKLAEIETAPLPETAYLTERDGRFVEKKLIKTEGGKELWGAVLRADYVGDVLLKTSYDAAPQKIALPEDIPVYGCRVSAAAVVRKEAILENIDEVDYERLRDCFYVQVGDELVKAIPDAESATSCRFSVFSAFSVKAIFILDEEEDYYCKADVVGDRADFYEQESVEFGNFACVYAEDFSQVVSHLKVYRDSLAGEEVPLSNGVFSYEKGEKYYVEGASLAGKLQDEYVFAEGKWCKKLAFQAPVEHRLKLIYPDGEPVTGATVKFVGGYDTPFEETEDGIYVCKLDCLYDMSIQIRTEKGNYYLDKPFVSKIDRVDDAVERTAEKTAVLYERTGIFLFLSGVGNVTEITEKNGAQCNKICDGKYYVYAPQSGTLEFEIKYYVFDDKGHKIEKTKSESADIESCLLGDRTVQRAVR